MADGSDSRFGLIALIVVLAAAVVVFLVMWQQEEEDDLDVDVGSDDVGAAVQPAPTAVAAAPAGLAFRRA